MIYYYIYRTTNILNNKEYIGVHKTNKLRDGYIGNGIRSQKNAERLNELGNSVPFVRAVLKYGYNFFIKEVLFHFNSYEEALEKEKELVNIEYVKRKDTYNIKLGGERGGTIPLKIPYDVMNNEGERFKGEDARLFCENKNLNYWNFIRLLKKERNVYLEYVLTENYKNYIIVNIQTNEVFKTNNLNKWCKENAPELFFKSGSNYLNLIMRGVINHCKGKWWCCFEEDWTGEVKKNTVSKLEPCSLIDCNNELHVVYSRAKFLNKHSLSKTQFYRLLSGKRKEYKGFKVAP